MGVNPKLFKINILGQFSFYDLFGYFDTNDITVYCILYS